VVVGATAGATAGAGAGVVGFVCGLAIACEAMPIRTTTVRTASNVTRVFFMVVLLPCEESREASMNGG
jgi:hypothetical protein